MMAKRYTVRECLDYIFDCDTDQWDRSQEVDSEAAFEEDVSVMDTD